MILILTALGFLLGDGAFGAKLINGLEFANIYIWILTVIIVIAWFVISAVILLAKDLNSMDFIKGKILNKFLIQFGKVSVVLLLGGVMVLYPAFILVLLDFSINNINPTITGFSGLNSDAIVSLGLLFVLSVTSIVKLKSNR